MNVYSVGSSISVQLDVNNKIFIASEVSKMLKVQFKLIWKNNLNLWLALEHDASSFCKHNLYRCCKLWHHIIIVIVLNTDAHKIR